MIDTVIELTYKVRELVEMAPVQALMVVVPLAMAVLAAASAAIARLVEDWLHARE